MTMRRALAALLLAASIAAAGCGFGLADDTGKPIPGQYWPWVCADGAAPSGDAGCAPPDARVPVDGGAGDR
ncbi:MAG TPA: hypothetical protein VKZ18_11095 [Polyangia bacterium]|nr:hypothetical protein [Polyangia bacterium]